MSLKTFHLIFVTLAVVLCIGFGIWCFNQPNRTGLGVGSLVFGALLAVYEVLFFKRMKLP